MPYKPIHIIGHAVLKGWSLIFYGTTIPIDKHDPVSVRLVPNSSLSINKYPVIMLQKPSNGGKNHRKQQKMQTIAPFAIVSPRKNGKNSKNNTGRFFKNQRTTTIRPSYQMSTSLFYIPEKSRKLDLNGYLTSLKQTTVRPKSHNNNVDTTGDKYIYDKLPIKAPKQVKQENAPPAQTTMVTNVTTTTGSPIVDIDQWTIPSANSKISKLFQKYEKIQEIYPELYPYVGPKNPTRTPYLSAAPVSSSIMQSSASNGKPSRVNSKSLSFTSSLTLSQQMRNPNYRQLTAQSNGKG